MIRLGGVRYACSKAESRSRTLDSVAHGNPMGQVAKDLGISESSLRRWMRIDDVDCGREESLASAKHKSLRHLGLLSV